MKSLQLSGYKVAFLDLYVARPESAAIETGLLKRPRIEKYRISKIYNNIKKHLSRVSSLQLGDLLTGKILYPTVLDKTSA